MTSKFSRIFYFLALLFLICPVQADDIGRELVDARAIFLQGVDGDRQAVRKATKRFRTLSLRYPENPVFLAYLGASMTLQGRDAQNNLDKQRLTEAGLKKIERALKQLPEDNGEHSAIYLDTQLVAASSFIYIPAFFNRYERGQRLLQAILEHHDFNRMAAAFRAATYFSAALVARGNEDDDEYRRYLTLTAATDPQGRDGRSAKKLLQQ